MAHQLLAEAVDLDYIRKCAPHGGGSLSYGAYTRTSAVGFLAPKSASLARIDSMRISRILEQARESHDMRRGRDEITCRL
jgi:hypothetical protein